MINIISHQADAPVKRGPFKVFRNLVKGLEALQYPYVINGAVTASKRAWVHDNHKAYERLKNRGVYSIVGPNLFSVPEEIPAGISDRLSFVVPSIWLYNVWVKRGFAPESMQLWPSGVDTDEFHPGLLKDRDYVVVYFKKRDLGGLSRICNLLAEMRVPFQLCLYGSYSEDEYKQLLSRARFCIWYGCHETQGIGLSETLAAGVPVLVFDDYRHDERTAAPYFSPDCGKIVKDFHEFEGCLPEMLDCWGSYDPSHYVIENLNLVKQAVAFIKLWEKWGLTLDEGLTEPVLSTKPFKDSLTEQAKNVLVSKLSAFFRRSY